MKVCAQSIVFSLEDPEDPNFLYSVICVGDDPLFLRFHIEHYIPKDTDVTVVCSAPERVTVQRVQEAALSQGVTIQENSGGEEQCERSVLCLGDDPVLVKLHIFDAIPEDTKVTVICIARERVFPKHVPGQHSVAPSSRLDELYVKTPNLLGYRENTNSILESTLGEIGICQVLKLSPHPNIAEYEGVSLADNLIVGRCFKRYEENLFERVGRSKRTLNIDACMTGIRQGVEHLHSLGICHNDINPANIMFSGDDTPVIIDFDSSRYKGALLEPKRGTPGWCQMDVKISCPENDYYSLKKIEEYLTNDAHEQSTNSGEH